MLVSVVMQLQAIGPTCLVDVQEHFLFVVVFAVVDCNRVVILVQAVGQRNVSRLLDMADI